MAGPSATNPVLRAGTGRPGQFCSGACRSRAHRQREREHDVPVEVDFGSASSRDRPVEKRWMVRLRSGERDVIVAIGLRQYAAERLVEQITDLLADRPSDGS